MLPQRKHHETTPALPPIEDELDLSRDWIVDDAIGSREPMSSPARMLHQELAIRLGDLVTPAQPVIHASAAAAENKWPIPARVATIVTISAVLWGGIYVALLKAITG